MGVYGHEWYTDERIASNIDALEQVIADLQAKLAVCDRAFRLQRMGFFLFQVRDALREAFPGIWLPRKRTYQFINAIRTDLRRRLKWCKTDLGKLRREQQRRLLKRR